MGNRNMQKTKLLVIIASLVTIFLLITPTAKGKNPEKGENYYFIEENQSITLEEIPFENINSNLVDEWSWGIESKTYSSSQVSGEAKICKNLQKNPKFIAPEIIDDSIYVENVTLKVLGIYDNGDYAYDRIKITIRNSLTARPGGPYRVVEGESVVLENDDSSGVSKEYNWGIENPINDMSLTDSVTSSPTFHAPEDVDEDKKFTVTLYLTSEHPGYEEISQATTTVKVLDTDLETTIENTSTNEGSKIFWKAKAAVLSRTMNGRLLKIRQKKHL